MPIGRKLRQRLDVVWSHGLEVGKDQGLEMLRVSHYRYVPRSNGSGYGWEVWDKKEERFVSTKELLKMSLAQLDEALEFN